MSEAIIHWFAMGGYGRYIWLSLFATVILLLPLIIISVYKFKRNLQQVINALVNQQSQINERNNK